MFDNMRDLSWNNSALLKANTTGAETSSDYLRLSATGFQPITTTSLLNINGGNYIYIAIRRGPMAVPTSGTSVFAPIASSNASTTVFNVGFPTDLSLLAARGGNALNTTVGDRLRGKVPFLSTASTAAEDVGITWSFDKQNDFQSIWTSASRVNWNFRRAPSFFDEVCYTGTGTIRTINHNLGVAPELMIVKRRDDSSQWSTYAASVGAGFYLNLDNTDGANSGSFMWNSTAPTSSVFTVGDNAANNASGGTYVNYLFATCAGVSKVGSYTGTGALLTVNCGFTSGARFVLIKRTDSTGGWFVWDSARGITAGDDPYLLLNTTAAEVTGTNYVDTDTTGFKVTAAAPAGLNATGGTYIFLAIA
jgi:hypothetical protein